MTIQSTLKKASATKLALANSLLSAVRELEKDVSGTYIAFVDHEEHSYDVAVEFTEKMQVKKYTCDCGDTNMPCAHILAVLLALESEKKTTDKAITRLKKEKPKKLTPAQALLEKISKEDAIMWLITELERDKRLFNNFKNHFENNDKPATVEYINTACKESMISIINKRRTVQLPELTYILESWQQIFDNAFTSIIKNIHNKERINVLLAIYENLVELNYKLAKSTTKIETFLDKFTLKCGLQVSLLPEDQQKEFFDTFFLIIRNSLSTYYSFFISFVMNALGSNSKELARDVLNKIVFLDNYNIEQFTKKKKFKFIEWLSDLQLLPSIAENLSGIPYDNDYNLFLIDKLSEIQKYEHAVSVCFECINHNYYEEYNKPYYIKIEEIIKKANDPDFDIFVKRKLLTIRINYEDFIYFLNQIENESDRQNFIDSYLSKDNIKKLNNTTEIFKVKMKVLLLNGKPDLVLNKLDRWDNIMNCSAFWDELYLLNKGLLLKKITSGINNNYFGYNANKYAEFKQVKEWLIEKYDTTLIIDFLGPLQKRMFLEL